MALTSEEEKNTFSREILARDALNLIDLSVEIDADKVEATLNGGTLIVTLPKLGLGKPSHKQASTV